MWSGNKAVDSERSQRLLQPSIVVGFGEAWILGNLEISDHVQLSSSYVVNYNPNPFKNVVIQCVNVPIIQS